MPARLRPLAAADIAAVLQRLDDAAAAGAAAEPDDVRHAVKHFLAVLAERFPGKSVEVRVPPYSVVQCVPGARHTRGTPPAVVEADAATWIALARGRLAFGDAVYGGKLSASGERSDLSGYLPLTSDCPHQ
ncbi:MAG: sterol carrier family protein [Nocardioidaceae bacterium]